MRKLGFAAAMAAAIAATGGAAPALGQEHAAFRNAPMRMDGAAAVENRTVASLLRCIEAWRAPGVSPKEPVIEQPREGAYRIRAELRSSTVLHFRLEDGVAMLARVEYQVLPQGAWQQLTDAASKRAVIEAICAGR